MYDVIEIEKYIINIFEKLFNFNPLLIDKDYRSIQILGDRINLSSVDLLYLYYEIKKRFNIQIDEEYIINNKFRTINDIIIIVQNELTS